MTIDEQYFFYSRSITQETGKMRFFLLTYFTSKKAPFGSMIGFAMNIIIIIKMT